MSKPILEFWYHMYGTSMGSLHIDIYYGGKWEEDIMTPIIGDRGDTWYKVEIDLTQYKSITKIRFRGITGTSYRSDMAIDDVKIWEPPANDAGILSIVEPVSPASTVLAVNSWELAMSLPKATLFEVRPSSPCACSIECSSAVICFPDSLTSIPALIASAISLESTVLGTLSPLV